MTYNRQQTTKHLGEAQLAVGQAKLRNNRLRKRATKDKETVQAGATAQQMRQLKSVQPRNNGMLVITFDSNQMVINSSFKGKFPSSKAWELLIENKVISLLPQNPRGNHKDFHEVRP
jgi:hypothetical protein